MTLARAPAPLEADVQDRIVDCLRRMGVDVFVHHGTSRGKRQSVIGFGRGFPDLMLCDGDAPFFAEIKRSEREEPRDDQLDVHKRLRLGGAEVYVWWSASMALADVMERRRRRERR